ncbi:hypothetical protein AMELA_G00234330 [Ameiurus melas]|uniref:Protrudin n=1 Tax=Ameiurus melas TaxID=219545 RepID=A0A7J5ZY05_AMEME|nr:hypothetical protein AMELA_G00234330 [Ameiurus melas]
MQPGIQETPPTAGERTEPGRMPSKDTSSLDSTSDLAGPRAVTFDLFDMVISYKRMAVFLEPVIDMAEVLRYVLGWRTPLCSLFCCMILNILFITLSEVVWFSIVLLAVSVPAVLGYLGDRCQGDTSDTVLEKKRHYAVQRRELQTVHMSRQEAMMEVKGLLKQLDEFLTQACVYAESVYKILYWESNAASSVFYGFLLMTVCLLYTAPVGWSLSLINSTIFIWNKDFCRVVLQLKDLFLSSPVKSAEGETEKSDPEPSHLSDQTPTPTSLEENQLALQESQLAFVVWPQVYGLTKALWRRVIHKDDDDVVVGGADYDSVSDNGLLSRNEPIRSRVSKLTEKLRKRVPTNATGNCSSCSAAFSVLKKRRSCSNCGMSLCSRCCSYKVFKSSMGATAPEAQRETVFVCVQCNSYLCAK